MNHHLCFSTAWAAIALSMSLSAGSVQAQQYPTKSVRVVVPFAPGGGTDISARQFSQKLSEAFGQQFIVDNRGGAGGLIGIEITVKAPPDGYTLMMMSASFSATSALHKPSWEPIKNIVPIAEFGTTPFVLVAHPSLPVKNAKDFIAFAKAKAGALSFASTGTGGITHLATELFLNITKVQMIHVPYKSTGAAMSDLLGGQVPFMVGSLLPVVPHVATGKLRALAVTSAKRWYSLPDVPPLNETVPGYQVDLWFGAMAPRGTPQVIIDQLNAALNKTLESPEMKKNLEQQGMIPTGGTPARFGERINIDYNNWLKVVQSANIKVN
ncbi:MAG TPA: tripartite tricarboxylate transporter substrate binding protein [Burkholderiales bacterium]|nr:tripartite tricarboxylate transporter substrate binding protein [Burkholderiales bacterium]